MVLDGATIVVLGSNSFSGQDFVDRLLDEPVGRVIGVSRSAMKPDRFLRYGGRADLDRFAFHALDMNRDMDALLALLDREAPFAVVNFAAQSEVGPSWVHPEHWFETNTVALSRLVNHLARRDDLKRYLHISSPEAYGSCPEPLTEDAPDRPSTPYAASKAAADMLVAVYARQFGLPAITIRASNVYGARQQLHKIVCRAMICIRAGRKIRLDGGGRAVKSFIHVRDVSEGELAALIHGDAGARYHLSPDGGGIAIRDLVARICNLMGTTIEAATEDGPERPGQDSAYVIDSSRARRKLDWRPRIDLDTGLKECLDWLDAHWESIRSLPHDYQRRP